MNGSLTLGNAATSHENVVRVSGKDTLLGVGVSVSSDVNVGRLGNSNRLEISDGGTVNVQRHGYVGSGATASNNTISVHNGTLAFTNAANGATVIFANAATLKLSGTNPVISVNGTLSLNDSTAIRVAFDKGAPMDSFIQTRSLSVSANATLTIDAKKIGLTGGLKDFPLVDCVNASAAALTNLCDSLDKLNSTGIVTVKVSDDNKQLLVNVANEATTLILLR